MSALSLIDEEHTLSFIKAQFIRVNLNPVEIALQEEKKLGTGTNKYRVSFLPGPDLDVRNLITLGELFVSGAHRCSCWDLYRTYTSLHISIRKIVSGSEEAVCLSNAKRHPHFGTGKCCLDR